MLKTIKTNEVSFNHYKEVEVTTKKKRPREAFSACYQHIEAQEATDSRHTREIVQKEIHMDNRYLEEIAQKEVHMNNRNKGDNIKEIRRDTHGH